ncbi:hypothetical protein ABH935_001485 [Catenulispora sp. GAS73]|uniref:hypothetical protein n=1 Tax=Catenulispora sp. GAS73 TaxID=3156269 RepID=UPI003515079B
MTEHSDSTMQTGLRDLLNDAAEDFFPGSAPYGAIVGDGRRRTRVRAVGGSALGLVAVGAAVAVGAGSFAGSHAGSPATGAAGQPPAAPAVSGEDMVKWLEQGIAPYGVTSEDVVSRGGTDADLTGSGAAFAAPGPHTGAYARLKIGYSAGVGNVLVEVSRSSWAASGLTGSEPGVTVKDLPDGSHLVIENPSGTGSLGLKLLDVAWYRSDGTKVDIFEINVSMEKGATPASELALTQDQVTKLVQSPIWDKAIASELAH